ncbi:YlbG family protein [Liquorilactobacillus mali]|uniref:UPF0298 protein FD00_GL002219 n=1 Tax=Liquorilactobacillus mali KCTC 3596 = DSM 20444 TaxID=1046596 RepID=J1F2C5_9LACO|nr:YlbG family protein [Liquorilactobacillus mali]EJE99074.1 hypothetical protein LMA_06476 [Liquorilactobacillus mali KCTC 3596 = DSM 20444]KRN10679.1 hypothetical protein FD00_GL002219 [Liquorilactobacillus mali KCTC 3596 = DSM 20444]MDC7951983.1 YlbG family protein [Liquorilactobacillus mali]QFQ74922.1 DUF2129 domain-containing protein [Liquorilactobacillus mali]
MSLELNERQGVIVYLYHLKNSRQLRRFGTIHYVSRKMKYVVLYTDRIKVSETVEKLSGMRYVKKVMVSPLPDVEISFADTVGKMYKLTDEDREKYKNNKE